MITSSHNFTIENLVIKDYVNNGVTVHGGQNATFRDLEIHNAGLYGVYPVECRGVLVERVLATGIKDAAIYVGQSRDIIVRDCEAHSNVTGIEIENSVNALVENNYVHDNTGGILVFLLPNNPSKVGSDTTVRKTGSSTTTTELRRPYLDRRQSSAGHGDVDYGRRPNDGDRERDSRQRFIRPRRGRPGHRVSQRHDLRCRRHPEGNRIFNKFSENGRNPGGLVKQLGAINVDILWDGSGWDNSFEQSDVKRYPAVLPTDNWPDVFRRAYARVYSFLRDRMM